MSEEETTSSTPYLKLCMIDDSAVDRIAFRYKMLAPETPFLRNVDLQYFDHPFESLEQYRQFDGVILDQELRGVQGTTIAQQIHHLDWTISIALITGLDPDFLPADIRDYVDAVGFKHGASRHKIDGEFGVLRAWVRGIARVKLRP